MSALTEFVEHMWESNLSRTLGLTPRELDLMDREELDRRIEDRLDDLYDAGQVTMDEYSAERERIVSRRLRRAFVRARVAPIVSLG
jgi:hypothetical protein